MVLADSLVAIQNAEAARRDSCVVRPASRMLGEVLKLLQRNGYVGEFELVDDGKSGFYKIALRGAINKCRSINPRAAVRLEELEKFEKRFLPSAGEGLLVISTPYGIMTQKEAYEKKTGGRLVAFVY